MNTARILAVLLLCILSAALGGADKPQLKKADPAPEKPLPREQLRYDGRSFDEWRTELLTDLKPQRRVRALKAIQRFAANGYTLEASAAVLEVMGNYDVGAADYDEECVLVTEAAALVLRVAGKAGDDELFRAVTESIPAGMNASNAARVNNRRIFALDQFRVRDLDLTAVVPRLGDLALTKDAGVYERAIRCLVDNLKLKGAAAALARVFKEGAVSIRVKVVNHLGEAWLRGENPELLQAAVLDREPEVRSSVAAALVGVSSTKYSEALLQTLDGLLMDSNEDVQRATIDAFVSMRGVARPVVPLLLDVLRRGKTKNRIYAISLLAPATLSDSDVIIRALEEASKDSNPEVRNAAFRVLPAKADKAP